METSPAAVNSWGRAEVMVVWETEKTSEPLSWTLKMLPMVPLEPTLRRRRSPVAVVEEPGFQ